jgi:hypothetical protein
MRRHRRKWYPVQTIERLDALAAAGARDELAATFFRYTLSVTDARSQVSPWLNQAVRRAKPARYSS